MKKSILLLTLILSACANTQTVRTSANTMVISTSGPHGCTMSGVMGVANKMAAIETIKAGYDGYLVVDGDVDDSVVTTQSPGQYLTVAPVTYGNQVPVNNVASTMYIPGKSVTSGSC